MTLAKEAITRSVFDHLSLSKTTSAKAFETNLAQSIGGVCFDLEKQSGHLRLELDWEAFAAGKELLILDEDQSWPGVFARLRGAIDLDRKRMGRFLLLGSVSPSLMGRVSESLAGRLSLVELSPFLLSELETKASRERRWLCGGYPDGGVLEPKQYPRWQMDYLALLSQRDLPTWGLPAKPQTTDRLLRMLAALHGQVWSAFQMGQGLGLSHHTVNSYLDYLAGAFLIRNIISVKHFIPASSQEGSDLTCLSPCFWYANHFCRNHFISMELRGSA